MWYYLQSLPWAALCVLPPYALIRGLWLRRRRPAGQAGGPGTRAVREALLAVFALYCGWLAWLVLSPVGGPNGAMPDVWARIETGYGINLVPFYTIRRFWAVGTSHLVMVNLVGNVVVFLPLGLCPPLLWRRWRPFWKVLLLAVGAPLFIETAQLFIGRSVDVDDWLLNFIGILLGYGLCRLLQLAPPVRRLMAEKGERNKIDTSTR